jgi:CheY-like chemotaxis protein
MLSEDIFEYLLLDLQMPVMCGYGAYEKIIKSGNTFSIIALTSDAIFLDRKNV